MNPADFRKIIDRHLADQLSREDSELLSQLLMQPEYQEQLDLIMQQQQETGYSMEPGYEESYHRMRNQLQQRVGKAPRRLQKYWWMAAAAMLLLVAGTWFFSKEDSASTPPEKQQVIVQAIEPGREGAVLTLADGSTILLDSMGNGVIAEQQGAALTLHNGQLEYRTGKGADAAESYNTLVTPKGRQFRIVLPDGTLAWLNAASSIRYPVSFAKDMRRVEISGEVYFEAKTIMKEGKKVPFIVNAGNRFEVEVMGTHFNVNAYADEPVLNTTLLEGKVAVKAAATKQRVLLQPGMQAAFNAKSNAKQELITMQADIGKVMAWKNGVFDFEDAGIEEVMRQLKRWYDIEVVYEAGVPDIQFVGKMTRDIPLNGLLIALEKSNVHFRLDGRTLVVKP